MENALLDAQAALNKAIEHLSHAQSFARTDDGIALIQQAIEAIEQEENEIDRLWEYIQRHAPR
jgi:hypothetical protein